MHPFDSLSNLAHANNTKLVLLVMDGLGGLPHTDTGKTELETAITPHMDTLAQEGSVGLSYPIVPGITPGSGPGHVALFGYDPLKYQVGRGVLESIGIGFDLQPQDIAIRCNFCTLDEQGNIIDRRAGRMDTEQNKRRVELLKSIQIPDVEIFIETVQDYRFCLILRGEGLSCDIDDTDPQATQVPPLNIHARTEISGKTALILATWLSKAQEILKNELPANGILLRGISQLPQFPSFYDRYKLKAASIAVYPMYKGVSKLFGMDVISHSAHSFSEQIEVLEKVWNEYDFFFLHVKKTDSFGEDGNFDAKVALIEEVDKSIPHILKLQPNVLAITGDHSTPAIMKKHSFHPLPVLLWSKFCRKNKVETFGETECIYGSLGHIHHTDILPLMLAHSDRLEKFGA